MASGAGSEILDSVSSDLASGRRAEPPLVKYGFLGRTGAAPHLLQLPGVPAPAACGPLFPLIPRRVQAGGAGSWGRRVSVGQSEGQGRRGRLTLEEELGLSPLATGVLEDTDQE